MNVISCIMPTLILRNISFYVSKVTSKDLRKQTCSQSLFNYRNHLLGKTLTFKHHKNNSWLKRVELADNEYHLFPVSGSEVKVGGALSYWGLFPQQWGTGFNSGWKLCGSGCVKLLAGLSSGWWDYCTGGTGKRAGDHRCLVIAFWPLVAWGQQAEPSRQGFSPVLFSVYVCVTQRGDSPVSPLVRELDDPNGFIARPLQ